VGTTRFRVTSIDRDRPYLCAAVEWLPEEIGEPGGLATVVGTRYAEYREAMGALRGGSLPTPELPTDPRLLSYLVAATVMAELGDRQAFLAEPTAAGRLGLLARWLRLETTLLRALSAVPAIGPMTAPFSVN
jgi:Lon protease-like protein